MAKISLGKLAGRLLPMGTLALAFMVGGSPLVGEALAGNAPEVKLDKIHDKDPDGLPTSEAVMQKMKYLEFRAKELAFVKGDNPKLFGPFHQKVGKLVPGKGITVYMPEEEIILIHNARAQMMDAINEMRRQVNSPPLILNLALCDYAQVRAEELSRKFEHERPDGTSIFEPIWEVVAAGENKYWHNKRDTVRDAVIKTLKSWLKSQGHTYNMLSPMFDNGGIGMYWAPNGKIYWEFIVTGKGKPVTDYNIKIDPGKAE